MEKEKHPCSSSAKLRHTLVHKRFTRSKQGPQAAEKKISSLLTILPLVNFEVPALGVMASLTATWTQT